MQRRSKIRHADTIDTVVIGFTRTALHPRTLAVQLPDGRVALSQRLTTALASRIGPRLAPQPGRASTTAGDSYTPAGGNILVEVVAGTTRHPVVFPAKFFCSALVRDQDSPRLRDLAVLAGLSLKTAVRAGYRRRFDFRQCRTAPDVRTVASVDSMVIISGTATGTAVSRQTRDPGSLLTAGAMTAAGLSMVNLWWAVPTAIAAFLAGRRPGRMAPTVLALVGLLSDGVVALSLVPAWLPLAGRFVTVVVVPTMLPWFAGRFWCHYQQLVRAGWERAGQLQREQELVAEQTRLRERTRIAQDMHDVLGHDLSLIALSAGALKLAPGP
ncbi:histidine kinase [Streptomyces sp. NPDC102264]|uniref:histidine kinase n=1 Tax=Streptomyces sp. NPDC102264 TaxID=3366149 RepID=UPI00382DF100